MSAKKVHFIGKMLLELPSCSSTNDYALDLLSKSKPKDGTVILTFCQTQGRGQVGSEWVSEPYKNIAFTCILFPEFLNPKEQISLNQAIALAVSNLLARYTEKEVNVKWPNDIYINEHKIAGILIQNILSSNKFSTSIVGIGINVNQVQFPEELSLATSLINETGHTFDLKDLVYELCDCLNEQYERLMNRQLKSIHLDYLNRLYRYQEWSFFEKEPGNIFKGKIVGISAAGKLQIENSTGVEEFGIKEIKFLN